MGTTMIRMLKAVLTLALAGSVVVQTVLVPLLWVDLDGAPDAVRVWLVVLVELGIVTLQVVAVCIWRLLSMVRRGTVFSSDAFRYVDITIGAIAVASLLTFGLAVTMAPGEAVAPGVVGLVCGAALVIAGVALVVVVLRMLLVQAVALDARTRTLQSELDAVI